MIRAIIFDMDGVVADTEPIYFLVDYNVLKSFGIVNTKKDYVKSVGLPARHFYNKVVAEKNSDIDINKMLQRRETEVNMAFASTKIKPSKGFKELAKKLKSQGYTIALASGGPRKRIDDILSSLKLKNIFSAIVSANDVKMNKPAPDIYIEAAKRLNMSPDECVAVEDSETGVTSAKSAGLKCIAVRTKQTEEHDLSAADVIVSSLKEIKVESLDRL